MSRRRWCARTLRNHSNGFNFFGHIHRDPLRRTHDYRKHIIPGPGVAKWVRLDQTKWSTSVRFGSPAKTQRPPEASKTGWPQTLPLIGANRYRPAATADRDHPPWWRTSGLLLGPATPGIQSPWASAGPAQKRLHGGQHQRQHLGCRGRSTPDAPALTAATGLDPMGHTARCHGPTHPSHG